MLDLTLKTDGRAAARVLCLGAHCDDIEIGCGATLLALQETRRVRIHWAVLSGSPQRREETRKAMAALVAPKSRGELIFGDLADGRFPAQYVQGKELVESLKTLEPDLILCHERDDRHQDHRTVNELVWNTFRDQVVLEYEIPKWDGGLGQPNVYIPISAPQARAKVRTLLECFPTQAHRGWFTDETFMAMLRLRGIECRASSGYAEGFHGRKLRFTGF